VITVSVPARADFVHVLRAVASSVAARLDMAYDVIEEVRILVDEASTLLLQVPGVTGQTFVLTLEPAAGGLRAALSAQGANGLWPPEDLERTWAWRVIEGLCDEVGIDHASGGPSITFVKTGGAWSPS
jgi:serine/threonine-protein kinase RsbW